VQYGDDGENMSLKKFRHQRFSSFIQCVNASNNQRGPVVGVRIDDEDGALLHQLEQFRVCNAQNSSSLPVLTGGLYRSAGY